MNIKHWTILLASAMLASCNFLEEYSQDQSYVNSWTDLDELLIGDCYMSVNATQEFNYSSNYGMFLHLLADEMDEYNNGSVIMFDAKYYMFGYWTWQPRVGTQEDYSADYYQENKTWTKCYKFMNVANNVLESAEKLSLATETEKQGYHKVKGEAHFLRAFYYFWLVNLYGQPYSPTTAKTDLGVPLKVNSEVYDVKYQRNTVEEVYAQVTADLQAAEEHLKQYTAKRKSIYRADITSLYLLASRVYLYMQNWDKAVEYADKVLAVKPDLQNMNSDNSYIEKKNCIETIFSMGGDDLPVMMGMGSCGMGVNNSMYAAYSLNDMRKELWFWKYTSFVGLTKHPDFLYRSSSPPEKTDANYYNYAYFYYATGLSEVSSLFWLRTSEAYLNKAEALAYKKNDSEALSTLREFMVNRYKPGSAELNREYAGEELIKAVRDERMREFICEGHRWFDLRRYRVNEVLPSKIALQHVYTYYVERGQPIIDKRHRFTLTEDDASWTLPIPHEVLQFNTGMPDNGNKPRSYEEL